MRCHINVENDAKKIEMLKESIRSTHAQTFPHSTYSIDVVTIFAIEVKKRNSKM
jgi:hypothetical protein